MSSTGTATGRALRDVLVRDFYCEAHPENVRVGMHTPADEKHRQTKIDDHLTGLAVAAEDVLAGRPVDPADIPRYGLAICMSRSYEDRARGLRPLVEVGIVSHNQLEAALS